MDVYFIEVSGIPKERLHAGLRKYDSLCEPDSYSLFLTIGGRFTDSSIKRFNIDDRDTAEKLIEYWTPRLRNRKYGDVSIKLNTERANAWQRRKIPEMRDKAKVFLDKNILNSVPKKTDISDRRLIIILSNIKTEDSAFSTGYLCKFSNDGTFVFSSDIARAGRYKDSSYCLRIINKIESTLDINASVKTLTDSDIETIDGLKSERWDFVMGRNN